MRTQINKVVTRSSARNAGEQSSSSATPGRLESSQPRSQSKRGASRKAQEPQTAAATSSSTGVGSRSRKATPLRVETRGGEPDEGQDSATRKQQTQRAIGEDPTRLGGVEDS